MMGLKTCSQGPFLVSVTFLCVAGLVSTQSALAQEATDNTELLYERNCASCHGRERQGSGLGPALSEQAYRYGGGADDLRRIITNGITSRGMPAFGATLSAEDIDAIVKWLQARTPQPVDGGEQNVVGADEDETLSGPAAGKITHTLDYAVKAEVWIEGLDTVWALDFIDASTALATERPGRLRVIEDGHLRDAPVSDTPEVLQSEHEWNQGGLLDVLVDTDYKEMGWIYLSYSDPQPKNASTSGQMSTTRVVRGRIRDNAWVDQEAVYEPAADAYSELHWHFGGRMAMDQDRFLYVTVGDRGARETAREMGLPNGKIHRVRRDGAIPADNPFIGDDDAVRSTFSVGNRNPQGLAVHPESGVLWETEHGPRGGDELNIIRSGRDYGWPLISHGINYDGTVLTPDTHAPDMEQPVYFWRPSIGLSGLAIYDGEEFPLWRGKFLVTALGRRDLRLLTIDGDQVQHEEIIFQTIGRPYEPVVGPDGAIYVVTSDPGQILRLTAHEERRR